MTESGYSYYMLEQIARAENWMPMIAGAAPGITNIDKLWATSRETPFYVPREAFRVAAREWQEHEVMVDIVNRLPESNVVPRMWFKDTFQHMNENYRYVVTFTGYNMETGSKYDESMVVDSGESLTTGEVLDAADERMASGNYPMEVEGHTRAITTAYHKHGGEW